MSPAAGNRRARGGKPAFDASSPGGSRLSGLAGTVFFLVYLVVMTTTAYCAEAEISYEHAVVAADHEAASRAGIEILKKGGNVVDAAVATGFALAVVRPASSGLGGGGFMVFWDAKNQRAIALDYREKAPGRATRGMYVDPRDPKKIVPQASEHGALAVAVPGHVAGLCYALHEYGSLDLATVLEPALRLCREGVPIDRHDITVQKQVLQDFAAHAAYSDKFASLLRLYANSGKSWTNDDRFFSPLTNSIASATETFKPNFLSKKDIAFTTSRFNISGAFACETGSNCGQSIIHGISPSYRMLNSLTSPFIMSAP